MPHRRPLTPWRLAAACAAALALAVQVQAKSLAGHLDSLVTRNGLVELTPSTAFVPVLSKVAIRSADYPVTATTPDFVYRYDPGSGSFTRTARALGSPFLDNADTVGNGITELGAVVLRSVGTELDGRSLNRVVSRFRLSVIGPDSVRIIPSHLRLKGFSLDTVAVLLSATRGISDAWDVNVLVPILVTSLDVTGIRKGHLEQHTIPIEQTSIAEERTGFGDVLLRTKYRLSQGRAVDAAALLTLRLPTGRQADFQGLGDVELVPGLALSRNLAGHDLHANLGVEIDTADLARSRARYGAGVALRLGDRWSAIADVFGSSGFTDERFPAGDFTVQGPNTEQGPNTVQLEAVAPRTDLVDGGFGIKVKLSASVVLFGGAVVPLTTDGLRPDVIPFGSLQATF